MKKGVRKSLAGRANWAELERENIIRHGEDSWQKKISECATISSKLFFLTLYTSQAPADVSKHSQVR